MMALFATSLGRWLIGVLAALAVLIGVYFVADHRGYQRAATTYTAQISAMKEQAATARADEIERQNAVNDAAKAAEARRIAQMQADNENLQSQIKELQREASEDPNAGSTALGAPSVQRVNQVR